MQTAVCLYIYAEFVLRKLWSENKKRNTLKKASRFLKLKRNLMMGKHKYAGKFSRGDFTATEMESLASFCETVFPPSPEEFSDEDDHHRNKEALRSFFSTSGSQTPVLRQVQTLTLYDPMLCFLNVQSFDFFFFFNNSANPGPNLILISIRYPRCLIMIKKYNMITGFGSESPSIYIYIYEKTICLSNKS